MSVSPNAPNGVGFRYKKTTESSWTTATYTGGISTQSGTFSVTLDNLASETTYDVVAYMNVWNGSPYTEITRSGQFTTEAAQNNVPTGWLELPQVTGSEDLVLTMYKSGGTSGSESDRNYTVNYSKTYYSALWTAYTLTNADVTGGQNSSKNWTTNNSIFNGNYQVTVTNSNNSYPSNYQDADIYTRGHQIPNADRTSSSTANAQTYYVSNQTPQIGNKFNGSIWGSLETAARGFVVTNSSNTNYNAGYTKTDVLYVITGPCYGKYGTSETPSYLTKQSGSNVTPASLPIPKYYWKVLLKVKWNGSEISSACAIGFWYEHKEYTSGSFNDATYVKSVNQIESWTGFNLFANLPDSIEESVENNSDWDTFRTF